MNSTPDIPGLRVLYLNAQGLTSFKFFSLLDKVFGQGDSGVFDVDDSLPFDVVFVAETWFSCPLVYSSSPFFLSHSPPSPSPNPSGHQHGGLLTLIHPHL